MQFCGKIHDSVTSHREIPLEALFVIAQIGAELKYPKGVVK